MDALFTKLLELAPAYGAVVFLVLKFMSSKKDSDDRQERISKMFSDNLRDQRDKFEKVIGSCRLAQGNFSEALVANTNALHAVKEELSFFRPGKPARGGAS